MKQKISLTIGLALSCLMATAQQNYTIKGSLNGQGNEKIILRGTDGNITVDATNNAFELSGSAGKEPFVGQMDTGVDRMLYLGGGKTGMYMPAMPLEVVLTAGAKLTVSGAAEDLNLASVTGDPYNDSFTLYRKALEKDLREMLALQKQMIESRIMGLKEGQEEVMKKMVANRKAISDTRKKFIKEHPDAFASLYFLSTAAREYSIDELEAAYNGLAGTYKSTRYANAIQDRIKAGKIMSSGGPVPDFSKLDVNGKTVSLSQFRGKYVLLDFWGSWCAPCRQAMPHLKELYTAYQSKGFEVLGISSEKVSGQAQAESMWKQAIEKDGLPWTNVLNNEVSMKQDVVQMFSIEAYPTQILLDKEGKIIGKWVGSGNKGVDEKLKEIFK
jgi:thiol-disulfide isomerase/thioredoxin